MQLALYLDMDGVLMDFDGAMRAAGIENNGYYHTPASQWTQAQQQLHASIIKLLNEPVFWPSVKPMVDANILWDWCRPFHPSVLTAILAEAADPNWVAECKRKSILQNFDSVFPTATNFHICLRHEKAALAHSNAVLVDDNPVNCSEWIKEGGIAVLHRDAVSTIRILRELYNV